MSKSSIDSRRPSGAAGATWRIGALLLPGALAAQAEAPRDSGAVRPLPIELALQVKALSHYAPPQLSPDGGWVAYTVQDPSRRRGRTVAQTAPAAEVSAFGLDGDVFVTNTRSGASRNLTAGSGNNWYPAWSPDGRWLAFYSDRSGVASLWVWDRETDTLRRASQAIAQAHGVQWPRWTSDGRSVVIPVLAQGTRLEDLSPATRDSSRMAEGTPTVTVYQSTQPGDPGTAAISGARGRIDSMPAQPKDLAVVDVATWQTRYLGLAPDIGGNVGWFQPSPDGTRLAFSAMRAVVGLSFLHDIVVVDLSTLRQSTLASGVPMWLAGATVSWSPDGRWLAYATYGPGADGEVYLAPTDGGPARKLAGTAHAPFGTTFRAPLWDPKSRALYLLGGDTLWRVRVPDGVVSALATVRGRVLRDIVHDPADGTIWSPDGTSALVLQTLDEASKRAGFYQVDLATGRTNMLLEEQRRYGSPVLFPDFAVDHRASRFIFRAQDARRPEEVWIFESSSRRTRRLSRIQSEFTGYLLGESRLVHWRARNGDSLSGALLLPAGYQPGRRYPLIVYPYGGSRRSRQLNDFGLSGEGTENMQLFATRGYAVLLPDTRLRIGSLLPDLVDNVLSGVDAVVRSGIADSARVGVMGHSFGGYNVIALIAATSRFRASVARAGFANVLSMYGEMSRGVQLDAQMYEQSPEGGYVEGGVGSLGGPPWRLLDRYLASSPLFHLARVETPLLLIHGTQDERVPERYSAEVYVWLSRLGKQVTYARYAGERHTESEWSYPNQIDYCRRVIGWFDQYLKGNSPVRSHPPETPPTE